MTTTDLATKYHKLGSTTQQRSKIGGQDQ